LVALENTTMTDTVTVKQQDIEFLHYDDSHIGLKVGEEITMEDAMHGMLLASANEVSHAIASSCEGGYDNFLQLMNDRAKELGCKNSNFMNVHGLHDKEHYTSARDMALIGAEVFKHEDFRRITATLEYTIPVTNITNETRTFQQHHRMLYDWRSQYYEPCVGGKTGYTDDALSTLVTFATKDDINLVAVVMRTHGSSTNTYVDTKAMLEYAFSNFKKVPITTEMVGKKGLKAVSEASHVMLPEGITFSDLKGSIQYPTELEDRTFYVEYTYNDYPVGKIKGTITEEYYKEIHNIKDPEPVKKEQPEKPSVGIIIVKIILVLLLIIILAFALLVCYALYRRRQRRKRRAELRRRKRQLEYQRYLKQMRDEE
jgi:D-alanyl-D-alanine carboxypeptidase